MRTVAIATTVMMLAGCSSFKLGTMMYCAYGEACGMTSIPRPVAPASAPTPAAKTVEHARI